LFLLRTIVVVVVIVVITLFVALFFIVLSKFIQLFGYLAANSMSVSDISVSRRPCGLTTGTHRFEFRCVAV